MFQNKQTQSCAVQEESPFSFFYFRNDSPLVDYVVNKNPSLLTNVLEYIIWRNMHDYHTPDKIILCHSNIEYVLNSQMIYLNKKGKLVRPEHLKQSELEFYEKQFQLMQFDSEPINSNKLPTFKRSIRLAMKKPFNHIF